MKEILIENRVLRVKCAKTGILKDFKRSKIEEAILSAARSVGGLSSDMDSHSALTLLSGSEGEEKERVLATVLTNVVISDLNANPNHWTSHHPPTVDFVHDRVIQVLLDWGFPSVANAYELYRNGKLMIRRGLLKPEEFLPRALNTDALAMARRRFDDYGIFKVEDYKGIIESGRFLDLVKADSKRYEEEVQHPVDFMMEVVRENPDELYLLIVAGPSSSGKSTTAKKICKGIEAAGGKYYLFPGDNYFYPVRTHPEDWFGDKKFEVPEAINLERMGFHLAMLMDRQPVKPLEYDFKTGQSFQSEEVVQMDKGVVILDCLHALYIARLFNLKSIKVYIEALSSLPGVKHTDIRMLRRMSRDVWGRGYAIDHTLEHWRTVRNGEFMGILPFQQTADFYVNGALAYDLPVLKYYLTQEAKFSFDPATLQRYKEENRIDTFLRGQRVFDIINRCAIPSDQDMMGIPSEDLSREFIKDTGIGKTHRVKK